MENGPSFIFSSFKCRGSKITLVNKNLHWAIVQGTIVKGNKCVGTNCAEDQMCRKQLCTKQAGIKHAMQNISFLETILKVLSNGARGGPILVSIDPF